MPQFYYRVKNQEGVLQEAKVEAPDERNLIERLLALGYHIVEITELHTEAAEGSAVRWYKKISLKDIAMLTGQLKSLTRAGLPLDKSLDTLVKQTTHAKLKEVLTDIRDRVREGSSLSDALACYPRCFSPLYINMVRIGESGGILPETLTGLHRLLKRDIEIRSRIKSAIAYPIFLLAVGLITIIVLLTLILPKFIVLFKDFGKDLPLPTRILLGSSTFLINWGWILVLAAIVLFIVYRNSMQFTQLKFHLDRMLLRVPVLGDGIQKRETSRFSRTLGSMLSRGIPLLQGLHIVRETTQNLVFQEAIASMTDRVERGESLAHAMEKSGVFPPIVTNIIPVGELSGDLDALLLEIADDFDEQLEESLGIMMNLLEPVMIVFMGIIVGFIVLSMLLPIFTISTSIK